MSERCDGPSAQALSFGGDAAGYDEGRLPYPERLWERLGALGLGPGARMFEIGAGTGIATRRLLAASPARLTVVEPDARMAEHLKRLETGETRLEVRLSVFEDAALAPAEYDLGLAATSFHWCDSAAASRVAFDALRPGGALALFWNVYQTVEGRDAFSRAVSPLFADAGDTADAIAASLPDLPRYHAALAAAGFTDISTEAIDWQATHDTDGIVALYATFSVVRGLAPAARTRLLDAIRALVEDRFGGRLTRSYHTPLLIAHKPLP